MKIARTQPPVGYRPPARNLIGGAWRAAVSRSSEVDAFAREAAEYFGVENVLAVSSGKAALTAILLALSHRTGARKVIVPAYTCYSVPSAIVKAGLEMIPCDIAPDSFDYDYDRLQRLLARDVLCVLSVHLFGVPSDTRRLKHLCAPWGIVVVEDAAQAMGGKANGQFLGTIGDVGFFSLGRGKNVTCGSGGLIVTNSSRIAAAVSSVVQRMPRNGRVDAARAWLTLAAVSVLISPRLYWLPAGVPHLHLGETIFHEDFPLRRLSNLEAHVLRNWPTLLESLNASRRTATDFYRMRIRSAHHASRTAVYLRLPLRLAPDEKRRLFGEEDGRTLGIAEMYPSSVAGIPQLKNRFAAEAFPRAAELANSLITLPTHPLLTDADLSNICAAVNRVQGQSAAKVLLRPGVRARAIPGA